MFLLLCKCIVTFISGCLLTTVSHNTYNSYLSSSYLYFHIFLSSLLISTKHTLHIYNYTKDQYYVSFPTVTMTSNSFIIDTWIHSFTHTHFYIILGPWLFIPSFVYVYITPVLINVIYLLQQYLWNMDFMVFRAGSANHQTPLWMAELHIRRHCVCYFYWHNSLHIYILSVLLLKMNMNMKYGCDMAQLMYSSVNSMYTRRDGRQFAGAIAVNCLSAATKQWITKWDEAYLVLCCLFLPLFIYTSHQCW